MFIASENKQNIRQLFTALTIEVPAHHRLNAFHENASQLKMFHKAILLLIQAVCFRCFMRDEGNLIGFLNPCLFRGPLF